GAFHDQLASVPADDLTSWADTAQQVSAGLAAWGRYDAELRPELYAAARVLQRSAPLRRSPRAAGATADRQSAGGALLFAQARTDGKGMMPAMIMLRQFLTTARAIRDPHSAHRRHQEAARIEQQMIHRL